MEAFNKSKTIVFVGRKQSGKNTAAKQVCDLLWGKSFVSEHAFAEPIKELCVKVLGVSPESVYGTDEEKMRPTHLLWEDFPVIVGEYTDYNMDSTGVEVVIGRKDLGRLTQYIFHKECYLLGDSPIRLKRGPITGRSLLQYAGTQILRAMDPLVFVKCLRRKLDEFSPSLRAAIQVVHTVTDGRFVNEVDESNKIGWITIGLTRGAIGDGHRSETEVDQSIGLCRYLLDNSNMNVVEQGRAISGILEAEGLL